ncbi:hypothetical protein Leryth_022436 [Lithospermum erythrorhizon]|nr:hypothetical protein Leryth_022436 [Lithospermum erythrorhizon]
MATPSSSPPFDEAKLCLVKEEPPFASVHYLGRLLDGTNFISTREKGEAFMFNLEEGDPFSFLRFIWLLSALKHQAYRTLNKADANSERFTREPKTTMNIHN